MTGQQQLRKREYVDAARSEWGGEWSEVTLNMENVVVGARRVSVFDKVLLTYWDFHHITTNMSGLDQRPSLKENF